MGGLGDITFAEIARALGRYRPVALTVLAVVVLLAILPNHNRAPAAEGASTVRSGASSGTSGALRTAAPAAGTEVAGAGVDSAAVSGSDAASSASATSGSGTLGASTGSSYAGGTTGGASTTPTSTYTYSPPSSGSVDTGDDSSSSAPGGASTPLSITTATWATGTGAGTPLATAGVPDGTLPVGRRLGSDDKRSFVHLTGTASVLTLKVDAGGARAAVNGDAKILVCQVRAGGWKENPGSSFADEPSYDDTGCHAGTPSADGTSWTFDLSSFRSPADDRGLALVPDPMAATDFQVTFSRA